MILKKALPLLSSPDPAVMSVLVCVCVLPKGRSLSSSARSQAPCVVCYRPLLWHWSPCHARQAVDSGPVGVDLLSTSAWQAQQQNLVVLLKLSTDPMIELNGFVFFLQEQTHLFLQRDQHEHRETLKRR